MTSDRDVANRRGYQAYKEGQGERDNPYNFDSQKELRLEWYFGWDTAEADELGDD